MIRPLPRGDFRHEAQIRAGHPDLQGRCRALADWSAELRLIEREARRAYV
jgi:hypothetical protein